MPWQRNKELSRHKPSESQKLKADGSWFSDHKNFVAAAREVYTTTLDKDHGLQDHMVEILGYHMTLLN